MGALAQRLQARPTTPSTQCRTCDFYNGLDDEDRAEFDAWLAAGRAATHLLEECQALGLEVSESSFRRHIRAHHGRAS